MEPNQWLRGEGLGVAALALGALYVLEVPWWLVVLLALAPDLGMVGYLQSPRIGAVTYNVVHWYPIPGTLVAAGVLLHSDVAVWAGLIWVAHIGVDRALGYGLKYADAFTHTHLTSKTAPASTGHPR